MTEKGGKRWRVAACVLVVTNLASGVWSVAMLDCCISESIAHAVTRAEMHTRSKAYSLAESGYQQLLADRDIQIEELRGENSDLRARIR